ncbi:unnamed protein product [Phytophthora lilii]|uniref:Large ribosomal subunit protein uL23m n=1 Tax=Phytophthora lilii TaxID=2077276 RepID=A0A9W6YFP1_9STRA|nr:unnamed protein product [Phytophthora lilii]
MVWNRVKFPNMAVTFMGKNARTRLRDNQFVFRVEPHYTKHEIKEYLTKVYDLPVAKVNTMNYEGAWLAGSAADREVLWLTEWGFGSGQASLSARSAAATCTRRRTGRRPS